MSLLGSIALHGAVVGAAVALGLSTVTWEAPAISIQAPPPVPMSTEMVFPIERPTPTFETREPSPQPFPPVEADLPFEVEHPVDDRDFVAVEPLVPMPDKPMPTLERPLRLSQLPPAATPASVPLPEVEVKEAPVQLYNPPPTYPGAALRRRIEGQALIEVTIADDGRCVDPRLVECSGSDLFGEAALKTIVQWKFRPAMQNGRAVSVSHRVRFVFRLK